MPVIYKCIKCGSIIYTFARAGQDYYGIPSPSELIARVNNICPYCNKPIDIEIDVSRIDVKILK